MSVKRRAIPQPVQLEEVPDPDGENRCAGALAVLVTARPGFAAVIQALVNSRPAGRTTPAAPSGPWILVWLIGV